MLKELESYLESILKELGYEETVTILPSSKRDLGWYRVENKNKKAIKEELW